jgi:hypothetical protein
MIKKNKLLERCLKEVEEYENLKKEFGLTNDELLLYLMLKDIHEMKELSEKLVKKYNINKKN